MQLSCSVNIAQRTEKRSILLKNPKWHLSKIMSTISFIQTHGNITKHSHYCGWPNRKSWWLYLNQVYIYQLCCTQANIIGNPRVMLTITGHIPLVTLPASVRAYRYTASWTVNKSPQNRHSGWFFQSFMNIQIFQWVINLTRQKYSSLQEIWTSEGSYLEQKLSWAEVTLSSAHTNLSRR